MSANLIIFNATIVTPLGFSAQKGDQMSKLCTIENGTVEVTDGIITYVGPTRYEQRDGYYAGYWHYNARGRCLLPGFVDSHTHFVFAGQRTNEFVQRLQSADFSIRAERDIAATLNDTRDLPYLRLRAKAAGLLKKMTVMGITTVEAKSGYGLDYETELRQLKIMDSFNSDGNKKIDIVPTFMGAHALPPEYADQSDTYINYLIETMLPEIKAKKLAECCDVRCELGAFTIEQSRRLLTAAKQHGFRLKIHADQFTPLGGAELAADLGSLSADHLLHISKNGISALAQSGVVATVLPLTSFALKQAYAPARALIDAGCAVALATNLNPDTSFSGSIALTFALACIHLGLTPEEAITALTLNGAAALGRSAVIGSIEVGKQGDFVLLNESDYRILPYYIGMNCVNTTIKGGVLYPI